MEGYAQWLGKSIDLENDSRQAVNRREGKPAPSLDALKTEARERADEKNQARSEPHGRKPQEPER